MTAIIFLWPELMKITLVRNTFTYLSSKTYTTSDQFTQSRNQLTQHRHIKILQALLEENKHKVNLSK